MTQVLRDEWKSDAFVVSDWNSIGELIPHGVAMDGKHAAELGINATSIWIWKGVCILDIYPNLLTKAKLIFNLLMMPYGEY